MVGVISSASPSPSSSFSYTTHCEALNGKFNLTPIIHLLHLIFILCSVMKKYTSLSTYLFLLLLLNRSVLAIHTENALTALTFNHHNGVWMNKGIIYSRCTSAQFDRLTCANFSLIHSLVTKSQVIRPDCSFLVHRISCALHKLNCPSYPESSFQVKFLVFNVSSLEFIL